MAQLAIGLIGGAGSSAAGFGFGPGFALFNLLFQILFPKPDTIIEGPRLTDLKVQTSTLGKTIPRLYGTFRLAGNLFWLLNNQITEVITDTERDAKGGLLGPKTIDRTFTYFATMAIEFAEGEVDGMLEIFADGKLIFDFKESNLGPGGVHGNIEFYNGTETQDPDPLIQADIGVTLTPAYRGVCYIVFDAMPLADFGNRIPNITATLVRSSTQAHPVTDIVGEVVSNTGYLTQNLERFYTFTGNDISAFDVQTGDLIFSFNDVDLGGLFTGQGAVDEDGVFYYSSVGAANNNPVKKINLQAGIVVDSFGVTSGIDGLSTISINKVIIVERLRFKFFPFDPIVTDPKIGSPEDSSTGSEPFIPPDLAVASPYDLLVIQGTVFPQLAFIRANDMRFLGKFGSGTPGPWEDDSATWGVGAAQSDAVVRGWPAAIGVDVYKTVSNATSIFVYHFRVVDPLLTEFSPLFTDPVVFVQQWDLSDFFSHDGQISYIRHLEIFDTFAVAKGTEIIQWAPVVSGGNVLTGDLLRAAVSALGPDAAAFNQQWWSSDSSSGGDWYFNQGSDIVKVFNIASWSVEEILDLTDWGVSGAQAGGFGATAGNIAVNMSGDGGYKLLHTKKVVPTPETLRFIVESELIVSKYNTDEFNMAGLDGPTVDGFVAGTKVSRGRDTIGPLQLAFFFDIVENDYLLRGIFRGATPTETIPEADLGTVNNPNEIVTTGLVETRLAANEMPFEVRVLYADPDADYDDGIQVDRRGDQVVPTREVLEINLPIAMSPDKGKQIARNTMALAWAVQRTFQIPLSWKYSHLFPSNVVSVIHKGETIPVRLDTIDLGSDGTEIIKAIFDDPSIYNSAVTGVTRFFTPPVLSLPQQIDGFLIAWNILNDSDDTFGPYIVSRRRRAVGLFRGAIVMESGDNISFIPLHLTNSEAVWGFAQTVLPSFDQWNIFDDVNTIIFSWIGDTSMLVNRTDLELFNGENAFAIGKEIVQIGTITDNGDGTYTGSHLLRARKGSEWTMDDHIIGEEVVHLTISTIERIDIEEDRRGQTKFIRFDSIGLTEVGSIVSQYTFLGIRKKPLPVVEFKVVTDDSSDMQFTWVRQTRFLAAWVDFADAPLNEVSEKYDVDIYDPELELVVRTTTVLEESLFYSRSTFEDDFGVGSRLETAGKVSLTITNPGAENSMTGWTTPALGLPGTISTKTGISGIGPHSGSSFFTSDRTQDAAAEQELDLVALGVDAFDIDAGRLWLDFGAWQVTDPALDDKTEIMVRYKNAAKDELVLERSGLRSHNADGTNTSPGNYVDAHLVTIVPPLTRFVDILIRGWRDPNIGVVDNTMLDDVTAEVGVPGNFHPILDEMLLDPGFELTDVGVSPVSGQLGDSWEQVGTAAQIKITQNDPFGNFIIAQSGNNFVFANASNDYQVFQNINVTQHRSIIDAKNGELVAKFVVWAARIGSETDGFFQQRLTFKDASDSVISVDETVEMHPLQSDNNVPDWFEHVFWAKVPAGTRTIEVRILTKKSVQAGGANRHAIDSTSLKIGRLGGSAYQAVVYQISASHGRGFGRRIVV